LPQEQFALSILHVKWHARSATGEPCSGVGFGLSTEVPCTKLKDQPPRLGFAQPAASQA